MKMLKYLSLIVLTINLAHAKVALITGITGQDGSYLAEFLLDKGYEVHGIKRRASSLNTKKIDHLYDKYAQTNRFHLHYGDLTDSSNILRLIGEVQPDEIYNLGAMSHVSISFGSPEYTADVDGMGVLRILEAIRLNGLENKTRFYQASTSEMFGLVQEIPQRETTPFYPRSPYGVAKLYGHWITKNYRESYNMYACSGILFNHESPRRGENFVTRKITRAVAAIKYGLQDVLYLGNLDASRDWGFAGDYVEAMWLMLQQDQPDDYVIATGETHTVREFAELAFAYIGINLEWQGEGVDEIGIDKDTGKVLIRVNAYCMRPAEVDYLLGTPEKAQKKLGWKLKTNFKELVAKMMNADLERVASQAKYNFDDSCETI